ncbi:polysulfide reductase NrfD [Sulfurospirillum diekertiae]|uniref:Polysulfide reductase NrfD n=1 Tax=Sulfurospirillum diekertiae TaxID=1854492 RepID=A0A290HS17_9BACT|nr:NrfD/PsrC family molybdoenzyme membrane anchor subunit [Sulfurospirillum diekertiae]ATB68440.1 polysulfide reductase-like protein, subunit C [Sulfurospirillum diekertiae]QIR76296.1 polysulfide reductase NrfD [Sulfurospirillum diekertiae]QIR78928.1 polysulfide reductase NrfD [Sulfurospirillum diekertiae]
MSPMWGSVEQYSTIHWSWAIAIYLFLAGLSSGSIIVALLVKWNRHERSNSSIWDAMIKAGAVVAPTAIFLGLLLLVIDLGRPLSFYWLLLRYNVTSVMSLGVLFLLIYTPIVIVFMLLVFERSVIRHPILAPLEGLINLVKSFHSYAKVIEYFLFVAALCVGSYTGFLLSALYAIPLWNSPLLPVIFLTSSLSSGVAVNILVGLLFFKSALNTESIKYLLVLDTRVILTELPLLALFFIGLFYAGGDAPTAAKAALTEGFWAGIFWLGVIGVGLGLPLITVIIALKSHVYRVGYIVTNSMVVVLGVLMLRYYIIYAGQIYFG